MSYAIGSIIRRAAAAAILLVVVPTAAGAQPAPDPAPDFQFLSRYNFRVALAGLAEDDDRFSWDGRIGADIDLLDYGLGRFSLVADYQAVMGNQLQLFDPNQGNYVLEGALSVREGANEFAAVFHHVSRHLSDRAKTHAIAMNVLGARVMRRFPLREVALDVRADAGRVIQHSYVDYTWIGTASLTARRAVAPHVGVFGTVSGDTYGVNPAVAGRTRQNGGRLEGGVRLTGQTAAIELFAGYERVVDADPLDRQAHRWAFAGFRVVN